MADVFISYSKTRGTEAAELAGELGDLGYNVWWDTRLLPTGSFGATIDHELNAARAVIVIWSPESVRSRWVRSEAEHGDRQDKLVNTHTPELDDPGSQIPKPFGQTHSVGIDDIRAIVAALGVLNVPRSGGKGIPAPLVAPAASVADADDRLFDEVQKVNTVEAYEYYLAELPEGRQKEVARFRLTMMGSSSEQSGKREGRYGPEGRIKVDARIVHGAPDGWFKPGEGKSEWFKDHEAGPEMVVLPAGSFTMGSPPSEQGRSDAEGPQHPVTFPRPFAVGRFAVAFDEWEACVKDGGCNGYRPSDQGWARGRQPVINVSWRDAKAYVAWLSEKTGKAYRLLSEAEREYVTRAGTTTPFWWGRSIATSQANYRGSFTYGGGPEGEYRGRTLPVDSFEPNPWGLFQVHGNVWEWVEDCWNENYNGAPDDDSAWTGGDCTFRVARGGSWGYDPQNLRSACRFRRFSVNRGVDFGFRVGRTLTS
jgi:formylglycine-generating enzyme required for sulfatase activity